MNTQKDEKWLDDQISGSIDSAKVDFDPEKWKQNYPQEVQILESRAKQHHSRSRRIEIPHIWRTIMKSKMTKYGAAAMVLIAVGLSMMLFEKTVPIAYALQDTIEAYSSVRSLHTKSSYWKDRRSELWVQCDDYGRVKKFRLEQPYSGRLFEQITVVNDGNVTDTWMPKYNMLIRTAGKFDEENTYLPWGISEIDPKQACERLYEQQEKGEVILEIEEPDRMNEPIIVTVTYPQGSLSENWRKILHIDQATKMVKMQAKYEMQEGEYKHVRTEEYFDYNQPIDPETFSLEGELPEDVIFVDQSDKEIGLAQGDMTDEEIAVEVGRQHFQAFIDQDYEKAGLLYRGLPAFVMELFGKVDEITEVGQVRADTRPDSCTMIASFKILAEANGNMIEYDVESLYIEPVYGQPGRWMVTGFMIRWDPPPSSWTGPVTVSKDNSDLSSVTYNGLQAGELMQKWLALDPVEVKARGDDLVPSKETLDNAFAAHHINVAEFEPEVTIGEKDYQWSLLECGHGVIALSHVFNDFYLFTYLWAQVDMPEEKQAILNIGSSTYVKIWLNGELVHERTTWKNVEKEDGDLVNVNFKKGKNKLVAKLLNPGCYWVFSCRLMEE